MNDIPGTSMIGYTDSINQPTKIRLQDGSEVAITDWSWRLLYSTVDILSGATDELFVTWNYVESDPVSCSSNINQAQFRNATRKDCNNEGKQQMPSEQEYICYGVSIEFYQFTLDDDEDGEDAYLSDVPGGAAINAGNLVFMNEKTVFALEITQKDFYIGSPMWFGAGGGAFVQSQGGAGGALRTMANNGLQSKDAIDRSPVPLHIGGTETFRGLFYNQDGLDMNFTNELGEVDDSIVVRARTSMIGLHKRPAA